MPHHNVVREAIQGVYSHAPSSPPRFAFPPAEYLPPKIGSSSGEPGPRPPRSRGRVRSSAGVFSEKERYKVQAGVPSKPSIFQRCLLSEATLRGGVIDLINVRPMNLSLE